MSASSGESANRRKSSRRGLAGASAFALLSTDKDKIPVLIINESLGGIGVIAVNPPHLRPGAVIQFSSSIRQTESRIASIKYVHFTDATVCRIGLEWTD